MGFEYAQGVNANKSSPKNFTEARWDRFQQFQERFMHKKGYDFETPVETDRDYFKENKENEENTDLNIRQKSRFDSLMKSSRNGAFAVTSPPKEITLTSVSSSRAAAIKGAGGRSGFKKS